MNHGHTGNTDDPGTHTHLNDHYPLEAAPGTFAAGTNARGRVSDPRQSGAAGAHTHSLNVNTFTGSTSSEFVGISNTGGSQSHNNMQPFVVVNKMIRIE
jgi:microcystin-dependent protein